MFQRYIDKYISYLEVEKNFSKHTIINYQSDLNDCSGFFKDIEIDKIDYISLRRFLAHLRTKNYRPRSLARKLSSMRSFFKFLHREGLVKNNPAKLFRCLTGLMGLGLTFSTFSSNR